MKPTPWHPRSYQRASIDALYDWFRVNSGNPLLVLPTGAGKSVIIAKFVHEVIGTWSGQRILMLTHVKELIEQNYEKLIRLWPEAPAGIYSASLNRRDTWDAIIYAGIQSVHNKAMQLGRFDLILIDEAHLVNINQAGMYRKFIAEMQRINPAVKVIGLTATAFRTSSGDITYGDNALFHGIAHEVTISKLLKQGYLCPLISKRMSTEIDTSTLHVRQGEFVQKEVEALIDRTEVTEAAINEILRYGGNRKGWLIFCAGVDHAEHIKEAMAAHGIAVGCITGKTPKVKRERIIEQFKNGQLRALTNANVLTTGFDAPHADLLAFLRPTHSPGLYVQMMGRGMRPYGADMAESKVNGKNDCLVLDFAGNVRRHGPVDRVKPWRPNKRKNGPQAAPTKDCPKCHSIVAIQLKECECGYVWPIEETLPHQHTAYDGAILSMDDRAEDFLKTIDITNVYYRRHEKRGGLPSMRVDYHNGILNLVASEWVCLEHGGFPRAKAVHWWQQRSSRQAPKNVDEAIAISSELKPPKRITINTKGKYTEIVSYEFDTSTKNQGADGAQRDVRDNRVAAGRQIL